MKSSSSESQSKEVALTEPVHPTKDSNSTAATTEKDKHDAKVPVESVALTTNQDAKSDAKDSAEVSEEKNTQESNVVETNGVSAVNKNNDKTSNEDKGNECNESGEEKSGEVALEINSEKNNDTKPIELPDSKEKSTPVKSMYQAALSQAAAFVKTTVLRQEESNALVAAANGNGVAAATMQSANGATSATNSKTDSATDSKTESVAETVVEIDIAKSKKDIPLVNETNANEPSKQQSKKKSTPAAKRQNKVKANKVVEAILVKQRKLKNFKVEKVAEDLPKGWIEHIHVRPCGRHKDHYWFTPKTGKRLRSRPEIQRFLANLEAFDGDEDLAFNKLKGIVITPKKKLGQSVAPRQTKKATTQTKTTRVSSTKKATTKRKREDSTNENNSKRVSKRLKDSSAKATAVRQKPIRKIKENKSSKSTPQAKSMGAKSLRIAESKQAKEMSSIRESKRMKVTSIAEAKTKGRTKILAKKLSSSSPYKRSTRGDMKIPPVAESK